MPFGAPQRPRTRGPPFPAAGCVRFARCSAGAEDRPVRSEKDASLRMEDEPRVNRATSDVRTRALC